MKFIKVVDLIDIKQEIIREIIDLINEKNTDQESKAMFIFLAVKDYLANIKPLNDDVLIAIKPTEQELEQ
jgi:hypothetical protein